MGFPGGSVVKNLSASEGDAGSVLESGKYPWEGNSNPLQYSCLENPTDRGTWWTEEPVCGVAKSQTQLND